MTDVFLAVGHGVEPNGVFDPGAIGADGRQEHAEANQICLYATAGMRRSGLSVITEAAGGASHDPDYRGSALRANALNPRGAVEVHLDWRGGVAGFSGLYVSDAGKRLASLIGVAFTTRHLPRKTDVHRSDLYFLNVTHTYHAGEFLDYWRRQQQGHADDPETTAPLDYAVTRQAGGFKP